jgi:uncharacterized protein
MDHTHHNKKGSRLRFNFGFMLEASLGTSRDIEINYPTIRVSDDLVLTPLQGKFQAVRTSEGIYLAGRFNSVAEAECGRCLGEALVPLTFQMEELFYYPPSTAPAGESVVGEDGFVDLAPIVRDLSLLEVPIQVFCQPDCKGLCSQCGQNLNEGDCDCEKDDIDPRFASLESFLRGSNGNPS